MKSIFIICFIAFAQILSAQQASQLVLEIRYAVKTPCGAMGSGQFSMACEQNKNKQIVGTLAKDSISCVLKKGKTKTKLLTIGHVLGFAGEQKNDRLIGALNWVSFCSKMRTTPKTKALVLKQKNYQAFEQIDIPFRENEMQQLDYEHDTVQYRIQVRLHFPICVVQKADKKNAGLVIVYYRKAKEHLDSNISDDKKATIDWGHAFVGVTDLKTQKTYFLDGWPDKNFHFAWNSVVSDERKADHHQIAFNVNAAQLKAAVAKIEAYRKAVVSYQMIDFNCTDATTKVLDAIGCYTNSDNTATVLPESFAKQLMKKLSEKHICYTFDAGRGEGFY